MFGSVIAGRPVQTNLQLVAPNKFVLPLEDAANINHVVIFLLGTQQIPPGFGASVYFGWPPFTDWKFLGFITNEKPSAVFRLKNSISNPNSGMLEVDMSEKVSDVAAQIGISIEPLSEIESQVSSLQTSLAKKSATALSDEEMFEFGYRTLQNFYNYASGFIVTPEQLKQTIFSDNSGTNFIPVNILDKWLNTFQKKLKGDPRFWREGS